MSGDKPFPTGRCAFTKCARTALRVRSRVELRLIICGTFNDMFENN